MAKDPEELNDALAVAVEKNKHDQIKKLLEQGANPNAKVSGMPVIISLAMGKGKSTVQTLQLLLAAGVKLDVKVDFGSPLGFAARWADPDLVEAMILGGAKANAFGSWALLEAVQANEKRPAKIAGLKRVLEILCKAGAKIDHPFWEEKITPLMIAASQGNAPMVSHLLELGADLGKKDAKGKTAYDYARKEKHAEVTKLLELRGMKAKAPGKEKPSHITTVYASQMKKAGPHVLGIRKISSAYQAAGKLKGCFPGCGCEPIHLAKIDLSQFPEFPPEIRKIRHLNVVYSACEQCDPEDFLTFQVQKDGKLKPWGAVERGDCDPGDAEPSVKETKISFAKDSTGRTAAAIRIGGTPQWVQNRDDWVDCEKCGEKPFYIGEINRFQVPPGSEGPGYHLYIFVCAKCKLETVVKQMT